MSAEAIEKEIVELRKKLIQARLAEGGQVVRNYTFKDQFGHNECLLDLFRDHSELVLVHNMGKSCNYCTLWGDGFIGFTKHIEERCGFAMVSNDPPLVQAAFHEERGWNFKMVSARDTSFSKDMGFEGDPGDFWPGILVFDREGDSITLRSKANFGPGDDFCSIWHVFDLLPKGVNGWEPS